MAQLERRLGESEAALGAAAEELVTLRNLNVGSGRDRDEGVHTMMTQLHDRVRFAGQESCLIRHPSVVLATFKVVGAVVPASQLTS